MGYVCYVEDLCILLLLLLLLLLLTTYTRQIHAPPYIRNSTSFRSFDNRKPPHYNLYADTLLIYTHAFLGEILQVTSEFHTCVYNLIQVHLPVVSIIRPYTVQHYWPLSMGLWFYSVKIVRVHARFLREQHN